MRKVIFAINSTINGFADHRIMIADEETHDFYANLLNDADVILFGRKTYQLMEGFWPIAYDDLGSTESMKRFADKINPMRKIVFSTSLKKANWQNSAIADNDLVSTVNELKKQKGKNISVGSLSVASQLFKRNLIDEFWFVVHPLVAGKGPRLLDGIDNVKNLKFIDSQKFGSEVIALHYKKPEGNS